MSVTHSREEILSLLGEIPQITVATFNGPKIRTRMMHFANDGDFNIYLASMKSDPKIIQMRGNPEISLLALKYEGSFPEAREVEITGWVEIVEERSERERWFKEIAVKSPVVKYLVDTGNTDLLHLIRVRPETVKYRLAKEVVQGIPPTFIEFPENKKLEDDVAILKRKLRSWAIGVRLPFLTASLIPITLGTVIAWSTAGVFNPIFFALAMLGGASLHLGTNILNDYFDHKSGTDDINVEFVRPFSGGSRVIQLGLLSPVEALSGAVFFLLVGSMVGLFFIWATGWVILGLLLTALVSAYFYTAPPLNLSARGVGELFVGLNFGILMTLGGYYVQTRVIGWEPIVAGIPIALLIAAVLYINEFPDYTPDKTTGKRHIVVRLGRSRAAVGYVTIMAATYISILASILAGVLPVYTAVSFLTIPLTVQGVRYALKYHSETSELIPANAATINVHLLTGVLLTFGYILAAASTVHLPYVALVGVVIGGLSAFYVGWIYRRISRQSRIAAGVKQTVSADGGSPVGGGSVRY